MKRNRLDPLKSKEQNPAKCCTIESLISIDERGQMVIPKDLRDKAKIKAGDKLALVSWEKNGEICFISLVKTEYLTRIVSDLMAPMSKY
ncbi:MAG: HgcAB-associated protein [Smithella sp.]